MEGQQNSAGLEHWSWEKRLGEQGLLCIKGRLWSTSWQPAHTREGIAEKMEEAMLFV